MKHTARTAAVFVSIVSTLAFAAPRPTLAGASLAGLVRSEVMSAVGAAKGAAAETEMRQLRVKAAMVAKAKAATEAKAAMEAQAAKAAGSAAMPALPVSCPVGRDWASMDERPSLVDNDRCR